MSQVVHPVILCGGSGTRLWPLSTPKKPKQFLALTSDKSMIEETADRFISSHESGISFARPLVVGSVTHEALLSKYLPQARQILEPFGRNSAPAVAAASLAYAPNDLILILSADHSIRDVPAFHQAIATAVDAANRGAIVTFGIKPTYPATEYGYIKAAEAAELNKPVAVERFVEKPPLADAEAYLESGTFFWNAGIFLFKAETMLDALETHAPDVLKGTRKALGDAGRDRIVLEDLAFGQTPSISIDFAIMEHADNVETIPVDMKWDDVGGYPALHQLLTNSPSDNATVGPVIVRDSQGLYVRSEGPVVTVSGLENLAVIATGDEVLVAPIEDATAIKALGAETENRRHALDLPQDLINRIRGWLWTAFEVWADVAWDAKRGGFVEQLKMDGEPDLSAVRRVRVQARQVFSFAEAIKIGWPREETARVLVDQGINYIDQNLRHPDGGWIHKVNPDGSPADAKRDLYDHAFIILAGATAFKVTGNKTALKIADDAIEFIDNALKDKENGGWLESEPPTLPRRANPHMHLLEAMLAYHQATGCVKALKRAAEVVRLFECRFFNPANDVMSEFFDEEWRGESADDKAVFEPGHHYEWATLLRRFEQITGHDTGSWRRRLIKQADEKGTNPETGFAFNSVRADGEILDDNSRLWHQLERLRTEQLHSKGRSKAITRHSLNRLFETYLAPGPKGGWIDEIDPNGVPIARVVPASMLYHFVGALSVALK